MEQSDRILFHRNRVRTVNTDIGREPPGSKLSLAQMGWKTPKALEELGI